MIKAANIYRLYPRIDPTEYFREFRFREYLKFDLSKLGGDLWGGLISAVVALPLALGFGILATGGDPRGAVAGLYGAIFTGILASLFGGIAGTGDNVHGYLRVLKLIAMAVGREENRRRLMEAEKVGQVLEVFGSVKE